MADPTAELPKSPIERSLAEVLFRAGDPVLGPVAPKADPIWAPNPYKSANSITLEQLRAALDEIANEKPVDRSRSRALLAEMPADFWETAPDEDQRFMRILLATIDEAVVHPRDAEAINRRVVDILDRARRPAT